MELLEELRRNHAAGADDGHARRKAAGRGTGSILGFGARLTVGPGGQRELDDHGLRAPQERELHLFAGLTRAHERTELVGVEKHLVIEAREDIAFLDLADGGTFRVDEADDDADTGGHGGDRFIARADIEAGVGHTGAGGPGGGTGRLLILGVRRPEEAGKQEHVEGNLAERIHEGPLGDKRR